MLPTLTPDSILDLVLVHPHGSSVHVNLSVNAHGF